jgi:hypothetical protein
LDTLSKVYPEKQPASLSRHLESRGGKTKVEVGGGWGRGIWVPICLSNEGCPISNPTRYINLVITHARYTYVRLFFVLCFLLLWFSKQLFGVVGKLDVMGCIWMKKIKSLIHSQRWKAM